MNSLTIALMMIKRTIGTFKGFFTLIIIPTVVVSLLIGFMGNTEEPLIRVSYLNQDKGNMGGHIIKGLESKGSFELFEQAGGESVVKEQVKENAADVSLVIPPKFTELTLASESVRLTQYQKVSNEASILMKLAAEVEVTRIRNAVHAVKKQSHAVGDAQAQLVEQLLLEQEQYKVKAVTTVIGNQSNGFNHVVIGFMLMFLMMMLNKSIFTIMDDRVQRTMLRIYTAPVQPYQIAVGNFLGSFLLGTLQIIILLVYTFYIAGFPFGTGIFTIFVVLEAFMLAAMGIAIALSGLIGNINQLSSINNLIVTPTCMIGGCFWPIEIMPEFMQKLSNIVPQKWAIDAIERMADGERLVDVGLNLGILLLFAIVMLAFGAFMLKPSEAAIN